MMFILRWPAILALFALTLLSFLGAAAAAGALTGFDTGVAQVQEAQVSAAAAGAGQSTWIDVGLWAGAGLFFLIAAVRLIRKTQGFWTWLIGFALYGGRWAMAQEGALLDTVKGINPQAYLTPQSIVADLATPEAQVGLLGLILVVGLLIFVIDAGDRSYWDKQGA
ncbi:MAG TPA: hypothetical protein VFO00_14020 [Vitreimonas sp.]|nr:hypothetical protein [Vitreimonas sp.]